ncbi:hypothetical protein ACF5F0_004409 [Salmonella enterica]|nr:hypothetical protein [Salmonella enterica]
MNNKLPEWRKALNSAVENYQSMRAWYEENPDNPSAEQDMDAAAGEIEKLIKQYGVLIVLNLLDEIDELQERRKAERGSEPVAWTDAEELSDLKRDGYAAMISLDRKDCEHADPRRQILLFTHPAPVKQPSNAEQVADLYALCWKPGDVVTYTPDPEKATIWLNNYSGTSVQEYVNLERLQEDTKHGLLEVAIARFSKMNEGFPIKRFKADWVISWMLENFPPVAQKQGDN